MSNLFLKIKKTMFPETWCVAYRRIENDNESLLYSNEKPFTVLPNTKSLWCADPFLFEKDGITYIFFEVLNLIKRKGLLGYRQIENNGLGDIKEIYEGDCHLSFPFILEENGDAYIIPESLHNHELFMLKCFQFPDIWKYDKTLISGDYVDSVFYIDKGVKYCITQKVVEEGVFDRVDVFYADNERFVELSSNPVKTDLSNSRGAGKIFEIGEKIIRPTQDCSESYGGKLNFNEITEISKNNFSETLIKTVTADDIKTNDGNKYYGIHTYNRLKNYEVIDLKLPSKFNIRNTVGAVLKVFKGVKK